MTISIFKAINTAWVESDHSGFRAKAFYADTLEALMAYINTHFPNKDIVYRESIGKIDKSIIAEVVEKGYLISVSFSKKRCVYSYRVRIGRYEDDKKYWVEIKNKTKPFKTLEQAVDFFCENAYQKNIFANPKRGAKKI